MAASIQTAVSDGTMTFLDISIDYLDRTEITVYFNDVLTTDWIWSGVDDKRVIFQAPSTPVPNLVEVKIKRTTDLTELRHVFSSGAAFTAQSLDEDLTQVLHIAQEAYESAPSGQFFQDIDMHGHVIFNLADAVNPGDAMNLGQYQSDIDGTFQAKEDAEAAAAAAEASVGAVQVQLADPTNPANGGGMVGWGPSLAYPANTAGRKLLQFRTFKDFGAVGDGVADDTAAIALAIASDATVVDDMRGGTYRITSQITIPNSCFTKFSGVGNIPVPASKFIVDFDGIAFKGAAGSTSFFCIEGFYCEGKSANLNSQLIDHDGDCVHNQFKRLVLRNFRKVAIDLNTAFRCEISFLGQYCWDYMLRIGGGSASHIKFTADHSYAGAVDINGGGHIIEPYTEQICSENNPAGVNASHREMVLRGGPHLIKGGVLSVHPQNDKFPISLQAARAVTFDGVSGFSLGAAPYWVDVPFSDSSCDVSTSPALTLGGAAASINTITSDPGYVGTPPSHKLGNRSVRENIAFAGCTVNAAGVASNAFQVTAGKSGTGLNTFSWASGLVSSTNYHVATAIEKSGVVTAWRVSARTLTSCTIEVNNTASTASADVDYMSVRFYPPLA